MSARSREPRDRRPQRPRERRRAAPAARRRPAATGSEPARSGRRIRAAVLPALIALLTLVAFWPALGGGFTNWDDPGYVTENYLIRDLSPHGLERIFTSFVEGNYHPLTMLSLALDYRLWGLQPRGYHLTSVLLHVLVTLMVFWFVRLLTRSQLVAAFVAVFFGIHPLHVESVAWVSGRKDLVYALFYLAGCGSYLSWARSGKPRPLLYGGALAFFVLSLLAKGMAVTFPLALVLIDDSLARRITWRTVLEKLPFVALAVAFGIVAVVAQEAKGAIPSLPRYPFWGRLLVACYGLVAYPIKAVAPLGLSAFYPYPAGTGTAPPALFVAAPLAVLGLAIGVWALARRSAALRFGALFYLLNVALVLQLFPVGSAVIADRYTYLSYLGVGLVLAEVARLLAARRGPRGSALRIAGTATAALAVVLLVGATRARCEVWRSSASLWSDVIRRYPYVGLAYKNRALVAKEEGRLDAAAADLQRAIALNPADAEALCNRGNLRFARAEYDRALADLDASLRLDDRSAVSHNSRGAVYFSLGRLDRALLDFDEALRLKPAYPEALLNRANTLSLSKRYDRAVADYDAYMALERANPRAYYWRALARRATGDSKGAVDDLDQALRLAPDFGDAWLARSLAHEARGDSAAALRDALRARELGSTVEDAYLARLRSAGS